jgi:Domain of unknown function (DUF4266)
MTASIRSHARLQHGVIRSCRRAPARLALVLIMLAGTGCGHVGASQREHLASPAMQFEMDPVANGQRDSILEITEGSTFPSAGPGNAGAGCGCN